MPWEYKFSKKDYLFVANNNRDVFFIEEARNKKHSLLVVNKDYLRNEADESLYKRFALSIPSKEIVNFMKSVVPINTKPSMFDGGKDLG